MANIQVARLHRTKAVCGLFYGGASRVMSECFRLERWRTNQTPEVLVGGAEDRCLPQTKAPSENPRAVQPKLRAAKTRRFDEGSRLVTRILERNPLLLVQAQSAVSENARHRGALSRTH